MAATTSKDSIDLSGTWHLNKKTSDDPDKIFVLQGVSWFIRKAMRFGSLSIQISQEICRDNDDSEITSGSDGSSTTDAHHTCLRVKQTISPTGFDSEGTYHVNGKPMDKTFPIFGNLTFSMSYIDVETIEDKEVQQALSDGSSYKNVIQEVSYPRDLGKKWKARTIWGFEMINGEKHLTRNCFVERDGEVVKAKMVYDYGV